MNEIKDFFDKLAPTWDERENCTTERKRALLERVGIGCGDKVLDVASGTGVVTGIIHSLSGEDVVGVDISPNMVAIAKQKYEDCPWARFEEGDVMEKDLGKYDFALIYNAYPHFPDPEALSKRLAGLLTEGGRFAIVHSLSRKTLDRHHECCQHISRSLAAPKEEGRFFEKEFVIEQADEGEDFYLLTGRKK